jgi:2,5-furandicarboxylate decarboxylase 1
MTVKAGGKDDPMRHPGSQDLKDLRSFLANYEEAHPEDVWRVKEPVDIDCVPTAFVLELERRRRASPILVFENVEGFSNPIVTNLFGTRERIAFMLETDVEHLHRTWEERTRELIPPVWTEDGPVREVVLTGDDIDLTALPIPKHFLDDADRYVCSGVCVARDPDTGVGNLAFARMQLKGRNKLGISVHSRGHLWDYLRRAEERGEALQIAVVIGPHPSVMLASGSRAPIDVDEYDIAGALQGRPVELVRGVTVDIGVPANAEIVIEGRILPGVREDEGPFGEYPGYSTDRSTRNVIEITAVTRRSDPIYLDVTPGLCSEHLLLDRVQKESIMTKRLQEVVSDVKGVFYPKSGTLFHCYVSLDKQMEGQPQQVGMLLLGLDQYVKLAVVVDADIDISNEEEVLWAMATRVQAHKDVFVVPKSLMNVLDPSSENGLSSKMVVDATAPMDWDATPLRLPDAAKEAARRAVSGWLSRAG